MPIVIHRTPEFTVRMNKREVLMFSAFSITLCIHIYKMLGATWLNVDEKLPQNSSVPL
jgi:hypothetical protein